YRTCDADHRTLHSFPTRRSSDLRAPTPDEVRAALLAWKVVKHVKSNAIVFGGKDRVLAIGAGQTSRVDAVKLAASKAHLPLEDRSEEHTSELQSRENLVCRLLLE